MKKITFLSLFFALMSAVAFAQAPAQSQNANVAAFKWTKSTTHDFGTIQQNKPVTATFEFTNVGKTALIITEAKGSCGCTGTTFPKTPVAPGAKGEITATFNAAAAGSFTKTVTVNANTAEGTIILNIKGEVVGTTNKK